MYNILKSEIKYFLIPLLAIAMLSLAFTSFSFLNVYPFDGKYFFTKYFWSLIIGMGTYIFVFIIWSLRKKESRDFLHSKLPLKIREISLARWVFGIAPFLLIYLYLELLRFIIPEEQVPYIRRINGQLGMMFFALAAVDLVMNAWYALELVRYDIKLLYCFIIVVLLISCSAGVVYAVSTSLIAPFYFGGEEFYFFLWGMFLSIISAFVFIQTKNYTSK